MKLTQNVHRASRCVLVLLALILAMSGCSSSGTASRSTRGGPDGSVAHTIAAASDALIRPFAADSAWNTPIPDNAAYAPPGNRLRASGRAWINASECGVPVYRTSPSGSRVQIRSSNAWNGGHGPATVEVLVDVPLTPSDCPGPYMAIVDQEKGVVYDVWSVVHQTEGEILAEGVVEHPLSGTGFGELTGGLNNGPLYAGTRASGASRLAGLLTGPALLESGRIDHALAICLHESSLGDPPVLPAVDRDNSKVSYRGSTPMGARLAIPPGVEKPDLSQLGSVVWDTFVRFGGYVVDACGGTFGLYAETRTLSDDDLKPLLDRSSGKTDLDRIVDHLQVVRVPSE